MIQDPIAVAADVNMQYSFMSNDELYPFDYLYSNICKSEYQASIKKVCA